MKEQTNSLNLRYFRAKEEAKQEISMKNIVTIKETIRIDIDQILEIGEFGMDKITEVDQGMNKAIGMTLEEKLKRQHKNISKSDF